MSELPGGNALVVGINAYAGGISPLQSAVRDARAIAGALKQHHEYNVTLLVDEQAGAADIANQLEQELPKLLDSESSFLLYFAGHGIARGDGSEGPKGFLIPHGAAPGKQDTWLSMDRVRDALQALPCRHLLVILDCCFAGSFRWAATRAVVWDSGPLYDSQYERFLQGTAWQALTSASYDEKAMDISPGRLNTRDNKTADGHSPFAAALMRGLGGDADSSRAGHGSDGVITATELYQYVFEELVPPGAPPHQTPGIWPL
ncbi:MAG: caspase family protein, partial [Gammaproteobacteria bacterium]|nr:caspase family protein [Gammaproteobacteria bacterium]